MANAVNTPAPKRGFLRRALAWYGRRIVNVTMLLVGIIIGAVAAYNAAPVRTVQVVREVPREPNAEEVMTFLDNYAASARLERSRDNAADAVLFFPVGDNGSARGVVLPGFGTQAQALYGGSVADVDAAAAVLNGMEVETANRMLDGTLVLGLKVPGNPEVVHTIMLTLDDSGGVVRRVIKALP